MLDLSSIDTEPAPALEPYGAGLAPLEEIAAKKGKKLRLPEPNELFLDLDSVEDLTEFQRRWHRLAELFPGAIYEAYSSATSGHVHVIVTLDEPVSEDWRLFYEACLGSDPVRAVLGWREVMTAQRERASCFFEAAT